MVLAFFFFTIIALGVMAGIFRFTLVEPPIVALLMWGVSAGLILVQLIDYGTVPILTGRSLAYLLSCIMAFLFGCVLARGVTRRSVGARASSAIRPLPAVLLPLMIGMPLVFIGTVVLEGHQTVSTGPVSLQRLKELHWSSYYSGTYTPRDLLLAITRPFAFVLAVSLPGYLSNRPVKQERRTIRATFMPILAALCWLAVSGEDILKGKRAITALLTLSTFAYLLLCHALRSKGRLSLLRFLERTGWKRTVLGLTSAIGLFYFTFGLFPALKNPALNSGTVDTWLSYTNGGAVVSDHARTMERDLGIPYFTVFAYGSSYITTPLMRYTYFLDETDIGTWYLLGAYNLPQFSKLFSYMTASRRSEFIQVRERIESISPYGLNPFKTGIIDFVIDFSVAGTLIVMFLWGSASQFFYSSLMRYRYQELLVGYSLLLTAIFSFPLFSLFYMGPFSNTLFLSLLLFVLRVVIVGLRSHPAPSPPSARIGSLAEDTP